MSSNNFSEIWQYAMDQIQTEYKNNNNEQEFHLWFNIKYEKDEDNNIFVSAPSEFMLKSMKQRKIIERIEKKIKELAGQTVNIICENYTGNIIKENKIQVEEKKLENNKIETEKLKHPDLNTDFTFETFVPGEDNAFAYNAAKAAALEPGKKYNPILLYGGSGLGKTHLMQSIGNKIYNDNPKLKICYISAESFANEFISSIESKKTEQFKKKYRNLDVLLIDDIHFLQKKEATQEELFYSFNELRNKKSQLVFTCDRPIKEMKNFSERLQSRISNGFCIDLKLPSYETRKAILLKKINTSNEEVPEDVIDLIAKNIETNIRDLEAALTKITAYAELTNKPITIEIAQQQLRDIFSNPISENISIETIQRIVAESYNISVSDLKSKKRDKKFVKPRQVAMCIAREITEYSFTEIGSEFGGRDHTTVMHSCEKISDEKKFDTSLESKIDRLIREIKDYKK